MCLSLVVRFTDADELGFGVRVLRCRFRCGIRNALSGIKKRNGDGKGRWLSFSGLSDFGCRDGNIASDPGLARLTLYREFWYGTVRGMDADCQPFKARHVGGFVGKEVLK